MAPELTLENAQELILNNTTTLFFEHVSLLEAGGRILAEDLRAGENLPPYQQSAVDGYAVSDGWADLRSSFTLAGHSALGDYPAVTLNSGEAMGVLTGGALPSGTEAVIPHEKTIVEGNQITILEKAKPGNNIKQAGEDFEAGTLMLPRGTCLDSGCMALLAAFGIDKVPVYRRPQVAIWGLGKNVIPCHLTPGPGQTRDSNEALLSALLQQEGAILVASELAGAMTKNEIADRLAELLAKADLIITTGGTYSDGENDSRRLFESIGAQVFYWGVNIQPGSHTGAARFGQKLLFSLSGNPAACAVGYQLFAAPALRAMQGMNPCPLRVQAACLNGFPKKSGSRRFVRGHASYTVKGWEVEVLAGQKPSMLRSLINCNALIDLPAGSPPVERGAVADIILLSNGRDFNPTTKA